ncbi:MAG: DUF5060 domain-containing protein, partial [Planctomycetes bacterium]|nr:DUF5060 domain-containing protein [Planctomycetota bacterium]
IDVQAHFISPSGRQTSVPGFFYQDYIRRASENKQELLIPMGRSKWKVRFTPREVGSYRYFVEANDGARVATRWRSFESLPSDNRGFVRVSAKDPSYFEFDNGEFFWPIGHNVCASMDVRAENIGAFQLYDEGTFAYDRYFDRMAGNGETVARIWLASWWLAMEWTKRLYVHHNDLGRYSLVNAWRLDYLLEEAQKRGIYVMLTFTPHGHLTIQLESNWLFHPYNYQNGGFLTQPHSFFAHPEARRYFEQQLRYVMARWGHSPNILCWELFNEIDLAEYYRTYVHTITEWIQKTAQYLRANDQGRHLITSNLFYYRAGDALYALPEIDFITAHVFNPDPISEFKESLQAFAKHGKPFYVTECEGHPFGSSPEQTENQMQMSLWGSYMLPMPGNAMPWWWVFIDERNLYSHFKALAHFAKGEERRGKNLKYGLARFADGSGNSVKGYAVESFQNDKSAL